MIEIKCRYTGKVLFRAEAKTIREAVEAAVKAKADLRGADLRDADLRAANLRDANLRDAVLRGADLRDANLRAADLRAADLRGADLRGADLRGADLRGADLRAANLRDANLRDAVLRGADLRGADLAGGDVPVIPDIHKAVAAAATAEGAALDMSHWHGEAGHCGTTHCRAGWAIHLAGDAGRALEEEVGPSAAAALIYQASDPTLEKVPDFYASNEDAMADIMQMAEGEAA